MCLASGSQPWEEVPGDILQDLDDEFSREFDFGVVELRREYDVQLLGLLDEAGSHSLSQAAEGFVHDLRIHHPFRDGPGSEGGPLVGIACHVAGEQVIEGARRGVSLRESLAEIPGLPQRRDE